MQITLPGYGMVWYGMVWYGMVMLLATHLLSSLVQKNWDKTPRDKQPNGTKKPKWDRSLQGQKPARTENHGKNMHQDKAYL